MGLIIRSRKTSHGYYTVEEVSGGYAIYRDGSLYKSTYKNADDAIREVEKMPN